MAFWTSFDRPDRSLFTLRAAGEKHQDSAQEGQRQGEFAFISGDHCLCIMIGWKDDVNTKPVIFPNKDPSLAFVE